MVFSSESPMVRSARELLSVGPLASAEELKKAYYRLALLYHPDRNQDPNASQIFHQIKKAFDLLNDPVQVRSTNRDHLRGRLSQVVIDGLQITFGSFFGFRHFRFPGLVEKRLRLGRENANEKDQFPEGFATQVEGVSILDHPAYDSLELVYAGRFSKADEHELLESFKAQKALSLPWVTLNHRGIYHFLKDELSESLSCYESLNERVPLNIIFMYRLGILQILLSFREGRAGLLGRRKPNALRFKKGVQLLEQCLKLGAERSVGKQRCLVIRKTLAEVYEKAGYRRRAKKLWQDLETMDPKSVEVAFRRGGYLKAFALLDSKRKRGVPKSEI